MPDRHPPLWPVLATLAAVVAVPTAGTDLPPEIRFIGNLAVDPSFEAGGMRFRSLGCAPVLGGSL